ncbi:MAG: hypothetical protein RLZZ618_443 [Pseudomonadota bacterium]|jgi:hypothetical protein
MSVQSLPAALQAWHPWLSWFSPELAAAVGDVLRRMHPLLGRFQGRQQGGSDEPDGVEDLQRKGSYERLLSSEWLLASELPDEFLRRAASAEHLFLAPRPRALQADRLIVAVFDAGPWQLGAPRLAHLALWILLARRAQEAGGELRWGVLHQPGRWHEANTPEQLKKLLQARTFDVAGEAQWTEWTHWLGAQNTGFGEVWRIGHAKPGAPSLQRMPSHTVCLRSGLDGTALDVSLRTPTAVRSMIMPLPAPKPAADLLRGQFSTVVSSRAHEQHGERLSLKMAPVISADGLHVAVPLLEGHGAMVFRVPRPTDRKRNKHRRQQWNQHGTPLCATFHDKSFCALLNLSNFLEFWHVPGMGSCPRPDKKVFDAPPGRGSLLPCLVLREPQQSRFFALDASNQLVYWVGAGKGSTGGYMRGPMLLDREVLAVATVGTSRIVYAVKDQAQMFVRFAGSNGREQTLHPVAACDLAQPRVFLSEGLRWGAGHGCCALQLTGPDQPELWRVLEGVAKLNGQPDAWQVQLAPGAQVVGLVHLERSAGHALVVLAGNRVDLSLHSMSGSEPLATLLTPIKRVSVCASSGLVAALTSDRALHVCDTANKTMRLIVHSGAHESD